MPEGPTETARAAGAPAGRLLPAGLLLFLGSIWGLNASIAKLAGLNGVAPVGFTTWQMSGAAVFVTAACLASGRRIRFDRAHLVYYLAVGIVGTGLPSVNLVTALEHLPAGVAAIALSMVPLFSYGMSLLARYERFDRWRCVGILLGFAGVLLIALPEASLPDPEDAGWFLMLLLTPFLYGFSSVAAARFRPAGSGSMPLAAGMLLVLALGLWPTAFLLGDVFAPALPPDTATWAVLVAVAVAAVAYITYFEIIRLVGPVATSVVGYIVTATGIGWGMLFFGERHSVYVWAAVGVIFAGLALVNGRQARAAVLR